MEDDRFDIHQAITEMPEYRNGVDALENEAMLAQEREPLVKTDSLPARGEFFTVVRCAANIEPEIVDYLWYPYFPLGKVGLLGGDSGVGKSYLTAAIATAHSLGSWPFFTNDHEPSRTPGHTLILSAEDGVADTYIPRLINLGADLSYIHFVEGKRDWEGTLHRVLLNDKLLLIRMIRELNAKLVMFDPLQSFLPPRTKMNDMESVRPVLDAVIEAASVTGCYIKLVGHLSKAKQETAGYKFLGSVDWFNACRSAMLAVPNPENRETERFFYHVKHSLGPKAPGRSYSITHANTPIFLWGPSTEVSVEDALNGGSKHDTTKEDDAVTFLTAELADGPRMGKELEAAAKEQLYISRRTLWRAKKLLKIQAHQGKGEFAGQWFWALPEP